MANSKLRKFVLHLHTHIEQAAHYDLMLESQDSNSLETFRLNTILKPLAAGETIALEKIAPHDIKFLSYQGKVNGGKGSVEIIQSGLFEQKQMDNDHSIITFKTNGNELKFSMIRSKVVRHDFRLQQPILN